MGKNKKFIRRTNRQWKSHVIILIVQSIDVDKTYLQICYKWSYKTHDSKFNKFLICTIHSQKFSTTLSTNEKIDWTQKNGNH